MIKKLILDKVRWARGGVDNTQLLNQYGEMCCLGYCMLQEGVSVKHVRDIGSPEEVYDYHGADALDVPYLWEKEYATDEEE